MIDLPFSHWTNVTFKHIEPHALFHEAPPAAGPSAGRARATQELHGAVRTSTAQLGPLAAEATRRRIHISALRAVGPFGNRGPEELLDTEQTNASTHVYLGTRAAGPAGRERAERAACFGVVIRDKLCAWDILS